MPACAFHSAAHIDPPRSECVNGIGHRFWGETTGKNPRRLDRFGDGCKCRVVKGGAASSLRAINQEAAYGRIRVPLTDGLHIVERDGSNYGSTTRGGPHEGGWLVPVKLNSVGGAA